jgi:hypothetical protein
MGKNGKIKACDFLALDTAAETLCQATYVQALRVRKGTDLLLRIAGPGLDCRPAPSPPNLEN